MDLQLVILAAGLGSRYGGGGGGLKQMETVGPGGATLMEYSLYDARRAGFGDVVFVVRAEMAEGFGGFAARFGSPPGCPGARSSSGWRTCRRASRCRPSGSNPGAPPRPCSRRRP